MLQSIIARMGNNSFIVKGWTLTLTVASFWVEELLSVQVLVAIIPVFAFWCLDSYFLRTETLFRMRYETLVTGGLSKDELMTLDIKLWEKKVPSLPLVMFSVSEIVFYFPLLIVLMILYIFLL